MSATAQRLKWSRDRDYEQAAHARMRLLAARVPAAQRMIDTAALPLGYKCGPLRALVGREPVGPVGVEPRDLRWHISVNGGAEGAERLATWHELVDAAHQIRPGVCFVVGVPPRSWWMAEIESGRYCLHLWEVADPNLEASWLAERQPGGRAPS